MGNPYRQKKKLLINRFKATVSAWLTNSNEQTLKAVFASILDVANMVPQQLLVCYEVATYNKVLRFLLGTAAASRNLVATALSGVAGIFGRTAKTTVGEFASVLEDPSLPFVLQMVLRKVSDAVGTMHRVCNACFLYFVTHITDFNKEKNKLLFDIRYMYPIMQYSGNEDLHKRVKKTTEDVLESFCTGPFSHSEEEGFVYYDVFPSFGILWYELVSGLMARHYCCVLLNNNKPLNFIITCYSVDQLLMEVTEQIKIGIAEKTLSLSFDYDLERDCVERLPTLTRRPWSETDHVVLFGFYHGIVDARVPNVTVPNNVTMVVLGTTGRGLDRDIRTTCGDFMDDLHVLSNSEVRSSGCEIVPGGCVYPNLCMINKDLDPVMGLFGCNQNKSIEHLIPNDKSDIWLDRILKTASDHVHKSGKMALLFISSCQDTDIGEKVSVGTDATYQAINNLPKTIPVITFDGKKLPDFDVHRVIQNSIDKRKRQHDLFLHLLQQKKNPKYIEAEKVVPKTRLHAVQRALDNKRRWDSSTRVPPSTIRGGALSCRPGVPFWTLVVVTVLAALAPELII
jgi:hypothetical protein